MSEILESEWVHIPDTSYVLKCKFDEGYDVLVSDLIRLYGEALNEGEIQDRFHASNPHAEMKTKVIVKNLSQCLKDHLQTKNTIDVKPSTDKLLLHLKFKVAEVTFNFDIQLNLLPAEKMLSDVFAPLIMNAALSYGKYMELRKKIEELEKDATLHEAAQRALSSKISNSFESEWMITGNVPADILIKSFINAQKSTSDLLQKRASKVFKYDVHSENQTFPSVNLNDEDKSCSQIKMPSPQCNRDLVNDYSCAAVNFDKTKVDSSFKTEDVKPQLPDSQPKVKRKKKIVNF